MTSLSPKPPWSCRGNQGTSERILLSERGFYITLFWVYLTCLCNLSESLHLCMTLSHAIPPHDRQAVTRRFFFPVTSLKLTWSSLVRNWRSNIPLHSLTKSIHKWLLKNKNAGENPEVIKPFHQTFYWNLFKNVLLKINHQRSFCWVKYLVGALGMNEILHGIHFSDEKSSYSFIFLSFFSILKN